MARARNPRRVALDVIKDIKSNASVMVDRWSHVPSLNWKQDEDGRFIHERRERKDVPASEYRENSPAEWDNLVLYMETIAKQAQDVATYARAQGQEARVRLHQASVQQAAECAAAECGDEKHLCKTRAQCPDCEHGHQPGVPCRMLTIASSGFSPKCGCQS